MYLLSLNGGDGWSTRGRQFLLPAPLRVLARVWFTDFWIAVTRLWRRHGASARALKENDRLALVDGDIGDVAVADEILRTALDRFGSVDALVNNAGIFLAKPFLDYTMEDWGKLSRVNAEGFLHITQRAVRQMVAQQRPGSVVTLTTSRVANPVAKSPAAVAILTKGGLEAATRSLALEFASQQIRFNAVAPGTVDTPMQAGKPEQELKALSPMGVIVSVSEIVSAVIYLTEAPSVTGEVLHVDGGAHGGRW